MAPERLKQIGQRIRRLRTAAEMTQGELAERSDLTAGFISQLERGKVSISIDSLIMILDALNIHISDFFRQSEERIVFKETDTVELDREGVSRFLALVPGGANRQMEPVRVHLESGETVTLDPFSGEQFGFVLGGRIQIHHAGKTYRASKNQSFYAKGDHELTIENASSREASLLWVTSPPFF